MVAHIFVFSDFTFHMHFVRPVILFPHEGDESYRKTKGTQKAFIFLEAAPDSFCKAIWIDISSRLLAF